MYKVDNLMLDTLQVLRCLLFLIIIAVDVASKDHMLRFLCCRDASLKLWRPEMLYQGKGRGVFFFCTEQGHHYVNFVVMNWVCNE
ncbi:hypothetical protein QQP08_019289, partial [Theobroma cacao]